MGHLFEMLIVFVKKKNKIRIQTWFGFVYKLNTVSYTKVLCVCIRKLSVFFRLFMGIAFGLS